MRINMYLGNGKVSLLQRSDTGENSFYIDGQSVAKSEWAGSSDFTRTSSAGTTFYFKPYKGDKSSTTPGKVNITLLEVDDTHFEVVAVKGQGAGLTLDEVYPVGSFFFCVEGVNPEILFPGTAWKIIPDRFLVGAGKTYTPGETGGAATVALNTSQMPSHSHSGSCNNHTHTITVGSHNHYYAHYHPFSTPSHSHGISLQNTHRHAPSKNDVFLTVEDSSEDAVRRESVNFKTGAAGYYSVVMSDTGIRNGSYNAYTAYETISITGSTNYDGESDGNTDWNSDYYTADASPSASASYSQPGLSIDYTGGGAPHENRPPYLAVWMWQRTA